MKMRKSQNQNRYSQIMERIFATNYTKGSCSVPFERKEIETVAEHLGIKLPKNLGDIVYSFRYRAELPEAIRSCAPDGMEWIILPAGRSRYCFVAVTTPLIIPSATMVETKIPDSTPGIIDRYALNDEQALLAKLRYNRLIDVFSGVVCYSLQNHLRTTAPEMGQVETDEIYVGVDRRGAHFVFPVQAKGGRDKLSIVQIAQDFAVCEAKFPSLICRPLAAQFMRDSVIAIFEFEKSEEGIGVLSEKHYRLVPPNNLSTDELEVYRKRGD